MIGLSCITTWSGRGGCRVHGEHLSTCRGIEFDGSRAVECSGCLPRPATHGLLCTSCHTKFTAAADVAVDLVTHLRSIERAAMPDGPPVHSKPGPRMILPASWLEADRVWVALRDLAFAVDDASVLGVWPYAIGSRATIEEVRANVQRCLDVVHANAGLLSDAHRAKLAVAFYRFVQTGLERFPFEETRRAIAYARCRVCGHRTLERRPPLTYREPVTVRCVNAACGAVHDPALVEVDLATYRAEVEAELAEVAS